MVVRKVPYEADDSQLQLKVNGKTDATSKGDMNTELLSGHLPLLLRPQIKNALVIGLGSGMTCGAIAAHPGVARLDVAEISPEDLKAGSPKAGDMIARNPKNHDDKWLMAAEYFADNFERRPLN